jgi:Ecdysteroid kinase-like family
VRTSGSAARAVVPTAFEEITPEWLTAALDERHPGVEVGAVRVGVPIHGTATNVAVELEYTRPPDDGEALPATMWLKAGFENHFEMMAASGIYEYEARFYSELAPQVAVTVPRCFYAGVDPARRQGVLLLEDMAAVGAAFGNATRPIGVDRAARVLDELARLHASTWGARHFAHYDFVTEGIPLEGPDAAYYRAQTPDVFERYLDERVEANTPDSVNDPERIVAAFWRLAAISRDEPVSVIHSDSHLDNVYFLPDGTTGLVDWQAPRTGSWAWDVSYFVISALEIDARRRSERDLLVRYLDRLASHGVDAPSFNEAWLAYRRWNAYGLFVKIVNPDYFKPREINVAWMSRHVAATEDLETFESLGV